MWLIVIREAVQA